MDSRKRKNDGNQPGSSKKKGLKPLGMTALLSTNEKCPRKKDKHASTMTDLAMSAIEEERSTVLKEKVEEYKRILEPVCQLFSEVLKEPVTETNMLEKMGMVREKISGTITSSDKFNTPPEK